jgi:hypothetical protein
MMAYKRRKLEEDEIASVVAEEESDVEVQSEVSGVEHACDSDDSVENVMPVIVTKSDNSTDDDRNNNISGMKDDNGSDGYSKNLLCKSGTVCTLPVSQKILAG